MNITSSPPLSGWYFRDRARYCFLISDTVAPLKETTQVSNFKYRKEACSTISLLSDPLRRQTYFKHSNQHKGKRNYTQMIFMTLSKYTLKTTPFSKMETPLDLYNSNTVTQSAMKSFRRWATGRDFLDDLVHAPKKGKGFS